MATKNVISPEDLERVVSLLERITTNCSTLRELCIDALDAGALADYAGTIAQGWPGTFGDSAEEWLLPKSCAPQRAGVDASMAGQPQA